MHIGSSWKKSVKKCSWQNSEFCVFFSLLSIATSVLVLWCIELLAHWSLVALRCNSFNDCCKQCGVCTGNTCELSLTAQENDFHQSILHPPNTKTKQNMHLCPCSICQELFSPLHTQTNTHRTQSLDWGDDTTGTQTFSSFSLFPYMHNDFPWAVLAGVQKGALEEC